jgi:hypothetical protein
VQWPGGRVASGPTACACACQGKIIFEGCRQRIAQHRAWGRVCQGVQLARESHLLASETAGGKKQEELWSCCQSVCFRL